MIAPCPCVFTKMLLLHGERREVFPMRSLIIWQENEWGQKPVAAGFLHAERKGRDWVKNTLGL